MQKPLIRYGIIGAGVAATTHARELQVVPGTELVAVFARDAEKSAAFAAAFSVANAYTQLDAFLACPEMEAVIITTPNGTHLDYAVAVAQAGKHVIVEKPLEIDAWRAQQIIDVCRAAEVGLFVIYQRTFSQAALQVQQDIASGELGQLLAVNIIDNQYRRNEYYQRDAWRGTHKLEGGGCVITQSTHMIDLAQFLLGPVQSVFAHTATRFHPIETEDCAVALLQFASGVLGTLSSSTAAYPGMRHLVMLNGTQGSVIFNGEHDQILFRQTQAQGLTHTLPSDFTFADPQDPRDYPTLGQRRQLIAITGALQAGEIALDSRALLAVKVVDALYQSAREQRLVRV